MTTIERTEGLGGSSTECWAEFVQPVIPTRYVSPWRTKIPGNRTRDRVVTRELKRRGWRVLRIWEHTLTRKHEARIVTQLGRALET